MQCFLNISYKNVFLKQYNETVQISLLFVMCFWIIVINTNFSTIRQYPDTRKMIFRSCPKIASIGYVLNTEEVGVLIHIFS